MKVTLARRVCGNLEKGLGIVLAAEEAISFLHSRVNGLGGVIVIDPNGNWTHHFNTPHMAIACVDSTGKTTLDI